MLGIVMAAALAVSDMMRTPVLGDVRLEGYLGNKMDRFITQRLTDPFQRKEIFDEARQAFVRRDDDEQQVGGLWRGEFWGKQMLASARVADYLRDDEFIGFVRAECHRLMECQDEDGYLGSYADKTFVNIRDAVACKAKLNWLPNWNLWNRKYCIWGMFMAYKVTGDRSILSSVEKQMDQWISMMHDLGIPLCESGTGGMYGMPSMSVLKPLLMLYTETGKRKYLDYATEMLPAWNRADNLPPNFFRNANCGTAPHTWYPRPHEWAKSYEMMSCLDGLLEYYRVTGDRRCLETVQTIRDLLEKYEGNPLGGVAFGDKFVGAASRPNGLSEVCDAVHWIRLNLDLFLITGEDRFQDAIERCYYNNFFAGVDRDGRNGSFMVRAMQCHEHQFQCGYAYNQCCVNNVPRTFMDFASAVVTVDREGVYHINQYQDATVTLDGVRFTIRGGYPVNDVVTVTIVGKPKKVVFRQPSWCRKLDAKAVKTTPTTQAYTLSFDMNLRVERVAQTPNPQKGEGLVDTDGWAFKRYGVAWQDDVNKDIRDAYRKTPALTIWNGPLLLAKSRKLGMKSESLLKADLDEVETYALNLERIDDDVTMGAWILRAQVSGRIEWEYRVCDYQSAADSELAGNWFSIWF